MVKPLELKGAIKAQAQAEDRHNPTMPDASGPLWARGLTTTRVADLFRTLPGLPGHWTQLQSAVNAGNNHFFGVTQSGGGFNDGGKTTEEGKKLITFIAGAVVSAAEAAKFDFPVQQLKFTGDMAWLKVARTNGRINVMSRP